MTIQTFSQLYLPDSTKRYLKSQIEVFIDVFEHYLLSVFANIEAKADKAAKAYHKILEQSWSPEDGTDPYVMYEKAMEVGLDRFLTLQLARNNLILTTILTLYQAWEQQVRLFLYKEQTHMFELNFRDFAINISGIKAEFAFHKLDIEKLSCWPKMNEPRLLANMIKTRRRNCCGTITQVTA